MSKLSVDQKTVNELFSSKKADFLIPDYQRPYAWQESHCQTLWDDLFAFAFPNNDKDQFNTSNDEYYLGPIVTFLNNDGKMEIIDGQQRLTTLMLLLRAFYDKFANMMDSSSVSTREIIEKCLWKTDEFGKPDKSALKISSEVATDNDKEEFLFILKTGNAHKEMKSNYAINYRFFQTKIDLFLQEFAGYFPYLPTRILNNCILLPIEAESQNTALRIFSTLNDRGMPLSDSDIFKAQFYKYFASINQKDSFIENWRKLESRCETIFHPITGTAMDELFTRYMYYERSKMGIKNSTTEALRKFYEKDNYAMLHSSSTFDNLVTLADFWNDVNNQSKDRFSDRTLRRLFVLNYAPNGMWTYFVSVYFMHYKDNQNMLDDDAFYAFLNKIIGFIWTYAVINPGVNALRTPVFAEMVNIVNNKPIEFADYRFDAAKTESMFRNFSFLNGRPITKSMLAWWSFSNDEQKLLSTETMFEIEHIYAKNRVDSDNTLSDVKNLEALGNKALLEKRINIRASDYRFSDKKKYYLGYTNSRNQVKAGTENMELKQLAKTASDFTENDIINRDEDIIKGFISYLGQNNLLA